MSCRSRAPIVSAPLTQIRRRYKASCNDMHMTIENDTEGWRVVVRDRAAGKAVHEARRCSLAAAKVAATEFAVIRMTGGQGTATVEVVAKQLPWDESW